MSQGLQEDQAAWSSGLRQEAQKEEAPLLRLGLEAEGGYTAALRVYKVYPGRRRQRNVLSSCWKGSGWNIELMIDIRPKDRTARLPKKRALEAGSFPLGGCEVVFATA
jgi:hypothetical protein